MNGRWLPAVFLLCAVGGAAEEVSAPKTVIKGSRMNLIRKGEAAEFTGGVTLTRGNDFLSADRMTADEKQNTVHAWGDVYLRRDDPAQDLRWEAWSDEGIYDTQASSGTLIGKKKIVRVKRSSMGAANRPAPLHLEADRMWFFQAAGATDTVTSAEARGRVYVRYAESTPTVRLTEVWSTHAHLDGPTGGLRFWNAPEAPAGAPGGRPGGTLPKARQVEGAAVRNLMGETIRYFVKEERLAVESRATATLYSPKEEKNGPAR